MKTVVIILLVLVLFCLVVLLAAPPAGAQGLATPTPPPPVVLTVTAAARGLDDAAHQRQAADQKYQQLVESAAAIKATADANYTAAQQANQQAQTALLSQQFNEAYAALEQSRRSAADGQGALEQLSGVVNQQKGLYDQQTQILSQTQSALSQCRSDSSTTNAYLVTQAQQLAEAKAGLPPVVIVGAAVAIVAIAIVGFVWLRTARVQDSDVGVGSGFLQGTEEDDEPIEGEATEIEEEHQDEPR